MTCKECFMFHDGILKGECACTRCDCYKTLAEKNGVDMDEVFLELLIKQGFIRKQETPSGTTWYSRTDKTIPGERKNEP